MLPLSFQLTSMGFTKSSKDARGIIVAAFCIYLISLEVENSTVIQIANPKSMLLSYVHMCKDEFGLVTF